MAKKLDPVDWKTYSPLPVIGVDEVGRGCLAGPVVACAVILSPQACESYFDSKVLSRNRREKLCEQIKESHQWALGMASSKEIDRYNILRASLLAMKRAVLGLKVKSGHILVDGKFKIAGLSGFSQTPLIKGDSRAQPISAASIVAKVFRDQLMKDLARKFPDYGFEIHKGYPTKVHRRALESLGPTTHHRLTFSGVEKGSQE